MFYLLPKRSMNQYLKLGSRVTEYFELFVVFMKLSSNELFSLVFIQSHFDEFMYFDNNMYPKVQENPIEILSINVD